MTEQGQRYGKELHAASGGMKRPLHFAGLVWFFGALLAATAGFAAVPVALLCAGALAVLVLRGKGSAGTRLVLFACCASILWVGIYSEVKIAPTEPYIGTVQQLSGAVTDKVSYQNYTVLTMRTGGANPQGLQNVRLTVGIPGAADIAVGDVIAGSFALDCPPERQTALYAQNILLEGSPVGEVAVHAQAARGPVSVLARYRDGIYENITRELVGEEGVILAGMLLGKTEQVPAGIRRTYARTGISHLLAVSGLHLTILTGMFDAILSALSVARRRRSLLLMGFVLLFMGLAGFAYSIVRSGIMLLVLLSAGLFGRDSDTLSSLGLAVILILIASPYAAFSVSLQLSYLATMGIAAFAAPIADVFARRWGGEKSNHALARVSRLRSAVVTAAATTISANLLTLPVICYTFGQVPLVSPAVNLLIAPLAPVALTSALLMGLCGFVPALSLVSRVLGLAGGLAVKAINMVAAWWSALPFAAVSVKSDAVIVWLLAAVALGVLLYVTRTPRAIRRYAACLMGVVLMVSFLAQAAVRGDELQIALAQNGGTVALVRGEQCAVIGSPSNTRDAQELCALLLDSGVTQIDLLITNKDSEIYSQQVEQLARTFEVKTAFGLDSTPGFDATVFGAVRLHHTTDDPRAVQIRFGAVRMVKRFDMLPAQAHILVNNRGDLITAPELALCANDRYFRSTVLRFRLNDINTQEVTPSEIHT